MTIARNYGPNNANVFGVNMAGAQGEENNKRLQDLMALLAQIRSQNMSDSLSRDRMELDSEQFDKTFALDKERQEFQQRPTFAINYTPRQQPTLADRNQSMQAWRQR